MEQKPAENMPGDKQPEIVLTPPKDKVCPSCGTVNPAQALYCLKCGSKLPDVAFQDKKICSGCHAVNSATNQYCYKCGLKLPDTLGTGYELAGKYAGFWVRFAARFIDGIILDTVIIAIIVIVFLSMFGSMNELMKWAESYSTHNQTLPGSFLVFYGIFYGASIIVPMFYHTIAIGKWGKTIGKKALGLKVVKPDGSRVSYWRAFGRYWADILNGFTLGIGYLVIAFTEKKRGLHDFICDTIVIKTN